MARRFPSLAAASISRCGSPWASSRHRSVEFSVSDCVLEGGAALAAGNCVVLKPASLSPLTALQLSQLAYSAGLPAGVLQVLSGAGSAIGDALVTHPLFAKSRSRARRRRCAHHGTGCADLKRVSLELGGKSPNIVFADADWEKAAETSR